ncbi:MAG: hypothetical protein ABFD85_10275 [Phycisphaerae bacterium]
MIIAQRRGALKLRHGRCPQIVRALHHLTHLRGDFIIALHRQQIAPDGLVDADLRHPVLVQDHQRAGLRPDARPDPFAHARRAHARQPGQLAEPRLDLLQLGGRIGDGGPGQRHVEPDAPVVDALVDVVIRQLVDGQLAHAFGEGPHGLHVLLAILDHLGHQRGVFAELSVRLRH